MRICRSCGGRYESIGADRVQYFHACPPVHRVKVRRGAAVILVDLADVLPTDIRLEDVEVKRPDKRDENVRVDLVDGQTKPKAEGLGADDV